MSLSRPLLIMQKYIACDIIQAQLLLLCIIFSTCLYLQKICNLKKYILRFVIHFYYLLLYIYIHFIYSLFIYSSWLFLVFIYISGLCHLHCSLQIYCYFCHSPCLSPHLLPVSHCYCYMYCHHFLLL